LIDIVEATKAILLDLGLGIPPAGDDMTRLLDYASTWAGELVPDGDPDDLGLACVLWFLAGREYWVRAQFAVPDDLTGLPAA
jgi:hypothetical protein